MTHYDLIAAIRELPPPLPHMVSALVAPDVWTTLQDTVPICRGAAVSVFGITIRRCDWLPSGTIVPLDQYGRPLPKPAPSESSGPATGGKP